MKLNKDQKNIRNAITNLFNHVDHDETARHADFIKKSDAWGADPESDKAYADTTISDVWLCLALGEDVPTFRDWDRVIPRLEELELRLETTGSLWNPERAPAAG